jgi:hypothetical protein
MNFIGHIYFVFVNIFMYSLRPKLLDTFDKNKNTKEFVRNLQKRPTSYWSGFE